VKRLLSLIALFSSGCLSLHVDTIHPVKLSLPEQLYLPAVGVQYDALLGDVMISKIDGTPATGFVAIEHYQPEAIIYQSYGTFQYAPIVVGSEWAIVGTLDNGDLICINRSYEEPVYNGVQTKGTTALVVNKNGEPYGFAGYAADQAYVSPWKNKPRNFLKRADKVYLKGSFKQELIYNGQSKDTIKLLYREFKEDLARPAFSQELTYDLSEGNIIGFRGMKIEVLEATNSNIQFIVRTPMN
jgi:hypothetical protein